MTTQEAIRKIDPKLRRGRSTAIVHNGSSRTIYGCVCGDQHSVDTRHRKNAKHVKIWRAEHDGCAVKIAMEIKP
jgi:hypothetical protein